jgi:transglutaminase-like putative cysteine protease
LDVAGAVDVFEEVRELPYAIDAAHDADALVELGAGDCLAKSDLLARRLGRLGIRVRMVRWLYLLPDVIPEVEELPDRLDLHRAVEVWRRRTWVLVDATHDPGLAGAGLTVGRWDGTTGTEPAYPPLSPRWVEDRDSAEITGALRRTHGWVDRCPPALLARWRRGYMDWLVEARGRPDDSGPRSRRGSPS